MNLLSKKKSKNRGAISIYFVIILSFFMLFSVVLIDALSTQNAEYRNKRDLESLADEMLMNYDEELFERYDITAIKEDLEIDIKNTEIINSTNISKLSKSDEVEISLDEKLSDVNVLKLQILKASTHLFVAEKLANIIDKINIFKKLSSYQKFISSFTNAAKKINELKSKYSELYLKSKYSKENYVKIESIDVNKKIKDIKKIEKELKTKEEELKKIEESSKKEGKIKNIVASLNANSLGNQSKADNDKKEEKKNTNEIKNKLNEEIKNLKISISAIDTELKRFQHFASEVLYLSKLSDELSEKLDESLLSLEKLLDSFNNSDLELGDLITNLQNMIGPIKKANTVFKTQKEKIDKHAENFISYYENIEKRIENLKKPNFEIKKEDIEETLKDIFGKYSQSEKNSLGKFLKQISKIFKSDENSKSISKRKIPNDIFNNLTSRKNKGNSNFRTKYRKNTNATEDSLLNSTQESDHFFEIKSIGDNLIKKFIIIDYCLRKFSCNTKEYIDKAKDSEDPLFASEIEYIIAGQKTSSSNINRVYAELFAYRTLSNAVSMIVHKNTEISNLASAFASFSYPLAYAILLGAYSSLESIIDISILKDDKSIPIFKSKKDIRVSLSLDNIANSLINKNKDDKKEKFKGLLELSYKEHLMFILLSKNENTTISRIGDLLEINLSKEKPFRLSDYSTVVRIKTITKSLSILDRTRKILKLNKGKLEREIIKGY